ncbi:DUF2961 domain-containing protein [Thermoanaerobacter italicus]|uniref:DUF2961 domain-containing protein n=1 Tax=Thermoanaerobacter italicus TaxID=108150 RepID=UPI001B7F9251
MYRRNYITLMVGIYLTLDGEPFPSIIGTGSEDYFNHGWGIQKNSFPFLAQ